MCSFDTLKKSHHGYVVKCKSCDHIQIAFGTMILSFNRSQFIEFIAKLDGQYKVHELYEDRSTKLVHVPTAAQGVAMVFSLNELEVFLNLLIDGRNALRHKDLFVFNEN